MRKIIILLFCLHITNSEIMSQTLNFGFGCELNQTRFSQSSQTITVPFKNPYLAGIGLSTNLLINYEFNNSISLQMAPLIGLYKTNSNITQPLQLNVYGFRLETVYKFKKIRTEFGLEYNRIHRLVTQNSTGKTTQWAPDRRNLLGPTLNVGYHVFNNYFVFVKSTYFLNDFYTTGALDYDDNVVGPIELTP